MPNPRVELKTQLKAWLLHSHPKNEMTKMDCSHNNQNNNTKNVEFTFLLLVGPFLDTKSVNIMLHKVLTAIGIVRLQI